MRYPPDQKERARRSLVDAGSRVLRENGFDGIGVDGIAAAAGVTSGALYSNFPTKGALLDAVVDELLGERFRAPDAPKGEAGRGALRELLDEYLASAHCDDPGSGCVMPTLSGDVARASASTRETYDRKVSELAHHLFELLEGPDADRWQRAWSIIFVAVGAVTVARAMIEGGQSREDALAAARATALPLVY